MSPSASPAQDPFALPLLEPGLQALYRHWLAARGAKAMPARKALDPTALAAVLANLFLYDFDAGTGRFYCRLAGERINDVVGKVCARRHLDEIFAPDVRRVVEARYRAIVTRPTLLHMHGIVRMASGVAVPGERLILPLASDGHTADGLIGAAYYRLPETGTRASPWVGEDSGALVEPGVPPIGWMPSAA